MKSLWILLLAWLPMSVGAGQRLDDSASPRREVAGQWEWAGGGRLFDLPQEKLNLAVARFPGVDVYLDLSAHLGQNARIYLSLPLQTPGLYSAGGLRLSWRGRGLFTEGSVTPGSRALLFSGLISQPSLRERLDFQIEMDMRQLMGELRFEPVYEIEVD
jgi:hypothetical protein